MQSPRAWIWRACDGRRGRLPKWQPPLPKRLWRPDPKNSLFRIPKRGRRPVVPETDGDGFTDVAGTASRVRQPLPDRTIIRAPALNCSLSIGQLSVRAHTFVARVTAARRMPVGSSDDSQAGACPSAAVSDCRRKHFPQSALGRRAADDRADPLGRRGRTEPAEAPARVRGAKQRPVRPHARSLVREFIADRRSLKEAASAVVEQGENHEHSAPTHRP